MTPGQVHPAQEQYQAARIRGQIPNHWAPLPLSSGQRQGWGPGERRPFVSLPSAVPAQPSRSPESQVQSG